MARLMADEAVSVGCIALHEGTESGEFRVDAGYDFGGPIPEREKLRATCHVVYLVTDLAVCYGTFNLLNSRAEQGLPTRTQSLGVRTE